jgi:hypothetical protein
VQKGLFSLGEERTDQIGTGAVVSESTKRNREQEEKISRRIVAEYTGGWLGIGECGY